MHKFLKFCQNYLFFLALLLIIGFLFGFLFSRKSSAQFSIPSITKELKISIPIYAESNSDITFKGFDNKNTLYVDSLTRADSTGNAIIPFNLGTQSDQRNGCMSMNGKRRVGICEDGNYTFQFQSTDAAGLTSEMTEMKIERDTVAPLKPLLSIIPYVDEQKVYLRIDGEQFTIPSINSSSYPELSESGIKDYLVISNSNWSYNTKYIFKVSLLDKAGNVSEFSYISYTTPPPPVRNNSTCTQNSKIPYPFQGNFKINSDYGARPLDGFHHGLDFNTPTGTEILSVADGVVSFVSNDLIYILKLELEDLVLV